MEQSTEKTQQKTNSDSHSRMKITAEQEKEETMLPECRRTSSIPACRCDWQAPESEHAIDQIEASPLSRSSERNSKELRTRYGGLREGKRKNIFLFLCPKLERKQLNRLLLSLRVIRGNDEEQSFYIQRDFSIFFVSSFSFLILLPSKGDGYTQRKPEKGKDI